MPWKTSDTVDLRRKFVRRVLLGEKISDLCREFDISRKTGHKIYNRFLQEGERGFQDASRRPKRLANSMDDHLVSIILKFKKDKPTWGAPKLRELFRRKYPSVQPPAVSTIHALLDRNGLVRHRRRNLGFKATGTSLSVPKEANDLWCTDFKGQFPLGDDSLCYPLTITDQVTRHIQGLEAMERIDEREVIEAFGRVFEEYGLPSAMRSDNGGPFASRAIFGLSKLSVYWLRLGIRLERIKPGNPQENGQHERMHRTLKLSVLPGKNILAQQEKLDRFREEFNQERPHEALGMKTPAEVYQKSSRPHPRSLPEIIYQGHDHVVTVSDCGRVRLPRKGNVHLSAVLQRQPVALTQLESGLWKINFMEHELGFFDEETYRFNAGANPFCLP